MIALLMVLASLGAGSPGLPSALEKSNVRLAPSFRHRDTAGKMRSLAEFKGRAIARFFFCGCSRCAEWAEEWGRVQRNELLLSGTKGAVTLVVYSGDMAQTRDFAGRSGLDAKRTVFMPDPEKSLTEKVFK